MSTVWELIARLTDRGSRRHAARSLARVLGADDLLVFVKDPEIEILIPALGFPQTLPRGSEWPAFVAECAKNGVAEEELPSPFTGITARAIGRKLGDGSVVVLLGDATEPGAPAELESVMPVVTSAFALERRAARAGQLAERAGETAEQARVLAAGLYAAQRDLQRALVETERAKDRFAFLADIGVMLASSLNHEATLAGVARIVTVELADLCVIDIAEDGETLVPVAWQAVPEDSTHAASLLDHHLRDPRRLAFVRSVMKKEKPWSMGTQLSPELEGVEERDFIDLLRSDGISSALVVPLGARLRSLGAMTLGVLDQGRAFDDDDLGLAQDLARRIALAVSNALLYVAAQSAIRTREEFLSIASHEFRTPVAAIKLNLQAIERTIKQNPTPQALGSKIATALDQLDRLDKLTNKLLDVTRIATGQLRLDLEKVDLVDVACDVTDRLGEHATRAGCAIAIGGEPRVVGLWDRIRIDQVVVNLLTNALRYGEGKPIDMLIESVGERARLTVRDRGVGIPRAALATLFQRFERAQSAKNRDGLGLGLYITRQIVEAHGGIIRVDSEPGAGATFVVELPLSRPRELFAEPGSA